MKTLSYSKLPFRYLIQEGEAGILFTTGSALVFSNKKSNKILTNPGLINSGYGIRNLVTFGINTCAGVMFQDKDYYVLIHAIDNSELHTLSNHINNFITSDNTINPEKVYLCTPNTEDNYEKLLKDIYPGSVISIHHNFERFGVNYQNIAIGKDILDIGDGYTSPIFFDKTLESILINK